MAVAQYYQKLRYYDPFTDTQRVRVSMANERGEEYWCSIPVESAGVKRREAMYAALDRLVEAVERQPPGEVRL